jgi:ubiquinone/menaquinone biosynthesis C-methylase UbiE
MTEEERIRDAYARRAESGADERYALNDPANRFLFRRRAADVQALLREHGAWPLDGRDIVDVGCGNGSVLREFVSWGAESARCSGIDLLDERAEAARAAEPAMTIVQGDASKLPWDDASFDLAVQFTLLSSVLDDAMRRAIAFETRRVLRPGGLVVVYDFVWNPLNRDVRGVGAKTLRALYAGCDVDARRVTLAPPITRRLARHSLSACAALERLPFLRSHVLAAIRVPAATTVP